MKVLTVIGTRPEAIKLAPVVLELMRHGSAVHSVVCVTGQHQELLWSALRIFGIEPHHDLSVMQVGQTPTSVAAAVMSRFDEVLARESPNWVLVQGDTTTAMAASITAAYRRVLVGHVEAGLRTFNKREPFPEEINRRITGVVADLHFAPTNGARENLLREGEDPSRVLVTGNPVIDALQLVANDRHSDGLDPAAHISQDRRIILVTAHRRENFGEPLRSICRALLRITQRWPDVHIVFPVHPNPSVRDVVHPLLAGRDRITLTEPLDYRGLVKVMKRATLVLTDSGGIQEEAPGLGKPVLVLREVTERPEAVQAGTVKLVGTSELRIVEAVADLLESPEAYAAMARATNPYGDGKASPRIVAALSAYSQ